MQFSIMLKSITILATLTLLLFLQSPNVLADNPGTYVNFTWPRTHNYNFDIDIQVLDGLQQVGQGVYWAHSFLFENGYGYMGLQIGTVDGPAPGKNAIFSIWNAVNASPGPSPGAYCVQFNNEGSGWSCHLPFVWKFGTRYRLRIWVSGQDANTYHWLGSVYDYSSGLESEIGVINAPISFGYLGEASATWTEYFATDWNCNPPHTLAVFSNAYARNALGNHGPSKAQVAYGATCGKNSNVNYLGNGVFSLEAGSSVSRTTPEGTWLWTTEQPREANIVPEFPTGSPILLITALIVVTVLVTVRKKHQPKTALEQL